MPAELTRTLLAASASRAVRVVASKQLADVASGADAFAAGQPTGLHDLRVALRRLRTWLQAYRTQVNDTLRKRTRKRLRKLAEATNDARDAEVALEWISAQTELSARERPGAQHMVEALQRTHERALQATRIVVNNTLSKLTTSLAEELKTYWLRRSTLEPDAEVLMSTVTRDVLIDHGEHLVRLLDRIESPDDFKGIHRARIASKRLRYLLQALNDNSSVNALVVKLTELQDALGNSHDMHGIANRLVQEIGTCAAHDAKLNTLQAMDIGEHNATSLVFNKTRPGLTALARRAHESDRNNYDQVRRNWRKQEIRKMLRDVKAYAELIGSISMVAQPDD